MVLYRGRSQGRGLPQGWAVIAFAYIRVSGDAQADRGLPVAGQREAIERYAQGHNITLARIFVDEARPGSTDDRPEFQAMMRLAHASPPPVDLILLWSWSRFARNQDDATFWKASLRRHGVQIQDISGETPPVDGFEYVVESLIHWKDAQRLKEISLDAKRGQQALARAGYIPSGCPAPPGFQVVLEEVEIEGRRRTARRWVPDPDLWPRVVQAWQMRVAGRTYSDITAATGLLTDYSRWTRFFANSIYKGELHWGDTIIPVPPAVSPADWAAVNDLRLGRESGAYARRAGSHFVLSGLAVCARCGRRLSGSRSNDRPRRNGGVTLGWRYYFCVNRRLHLCDLPRIGADRLERAVIDEIFAQVLTPDAITERLDAIRAQLETERPTLDAQRAQLERDHADAQRAIARLLDTIERSPASDALLARLKEREAEAARLALALRTLDAQLAAPQRAYDEILHLRPALEAALQSGPPSAVRALLSQFLSQVLVDQDHITLRFRLP